MTLMRRRAARGPAAGVILLLAGVIALVVGCVAGEPGGTASVPAATDLPTSALSSTVAPLPAATDLPTYAASPAATMPATPTAMALPGATPLPTVTDVPEGFLPIHVPSRTQIRLMHRLDADPDYYCLDVPGFGGSIRLDAPLQAHTCKWDADDQLFYVFGPIIERDTTEGRLCVTVSDMATGATLLLDECYFDKAEWTGTQIRDEQWFRFPDNPRPAVLFSLHTGNAGELCVGVAGGAGEPAGGRNHLRRDLRVYDCAAADPSLITWIFRVEGAHIN